MDFHISSQCKLSPPFPGEMTISEPLGTTLCPLSIWGREPIADDLGSVSLRHPSTLPQLAQLSLAAVSLCSGGNQDGLVLSSLFHFQPCRSLFRPRPGSGCQGTWNPPLQDCQVEHLPIPIPVRNSTSVELK